jgi:hypothetical protein
MITAYHDTLRSLRWRPGASAGAAIKILFVIDQICLKLKSIFLHAFPSINLHYKILLKS